MRWRRLLPVVLLPTLLVACGSPSPSPSASGAPSATSHPSTSASPSPSSTGPALTVAPLIPSLAPGGVLNLLREDGSVSGSIPASRPLQLFSPLGDRFLAATQSGAASTAIVAIHNDGNVETLHPIADPTTFAGATGALDGHAWAWLQGTRFSGICNSGLSSGTLYVQTPGAQPRTVAQLSAGASGTAWSFGAWSGSSIWLVQTGGCPANGNYTTAAFIAHEDGSAMTPVQAQLGAGCQLTSVALDGSMLCAAQLTTPARARWRTVSPAGAVHDYTTAALTGACGGRGPLHDLEGLAMSLDGRSISADAGCVGGTRFDQLYIINTDTATVQQPQGGAPYLAADAWLPDGRLLCNDLTDPNAVNAYLVTPSGAVGHLATGTATWAGNNVTW